jgi:hypothetical protein
MALCLCRLRDAPMDQSRRQARLLQGKGLDLLRQIGMEFPASCIGALTPYQS